MRQRADQYAPKTGVLPLQPSLFDAGPLGAAVAENPEVSPRTGSLRKVAPKSRDLPSLRSKRSHQVRLVREEELPLYPAELVAAVIASINELPADQLWFTYKSIQRSFGVSRATVARRMRQGLVPGVRFRQGRMVEEGAVRRFDRLQLRYLLLSVRSVCAG